jgi:hypothetical protein
MITDQGWAFSSGSTKAHYFRADKRSLCGKYGSIGMGERLFTPEARDPKSGRSATQWDCAPCRRKLDKEGVK